MRSTYLIKGDYQMKELVLKNGDAVVIRKARSTDAKEILDYVNIISSESDFLTFGQGEFIMSLEQEEKFLENAYMQNNALYIIAIIDKKIVGTLNFSAGTRPRIAHTGEFGVSVLKEYWGNGIGTELIKYMLEWGKQSEIVRKINLKVRRDNFSAIHLYKKMGFVQEGVLTRDLQINGTFYDSILMGYTID